MGDEFVPANALEGGLFEETHLFRYPMSHVTIHNRLEKVSISHTLLSF
jgi:hypothetical protein